MRSFTTFAVSMAVGLGLVISGCASSPSGGWTKPGMTQEELGRDTANCLLDGRKTLPGPDGPRQVIDQDRYRRCMAARGYTDGPEK